MEENTKKLCDDILRYGTILGDDEFAFGGIRTRRYEIQCEGIIYVLVKVNGVWKQLYKVIE